MRDFMDRAEESAAAEFGRRNVGLFLAARTLRALVPALLAAAGLGLLGGAGWWLMSSWRPDWTQSLAIGIATLVGLVALLRVAAGRRRYRVRRYRGSRWPF